jgi:hypothetical protein
MAQRSELRAEFRRDAFGMRRLGQAQRKWSLPFASPR